MVKKGGWDAVVISTVVVILAFALVVAPMTAADIVWSLVAVALLMLGYVFFARPQIGADVRHWRTAAFVVVAAVALVVGVSAELFLAMLQTIVYPLVWVTSSARKPAIAGSFVISIAVFFGFAIHDGFSPEIISSGLTTAGFSVVFAVVFGLWIASIADHAEERGRLVAELTEAQATVEALSRDRGASAERERLAREIHDTLAQTLAGLVLLAERAGRQSRDGSVDAAIDTITTVEQVARDALDESRALVASTASVPSEAALGAALERLAARFRAESGLEVDIVHRGSEQELARESQVVVLRCVQEALSNVRKHAGAARVEVSVAVDAEGGTTLVVRDDGRGFDADVKRTGFGLDGMRDRVALAGGSFDVVTGAGRGVVLTVTLPGGAPGAASGTFPGGVSRTAPGVGAGGAPDVASDGALAAVLPGVQVKSPVGEADPGPDGEIVAADSTDDPVNVASGGSA